MITKLLIDRARWVNGCTRKYLGLSLLLNKEGNMCCLGFLGKACGLTDKQLVGNGGPSCVPLLNWPKEILFRNIEDEIIRINDRLGVSHEKREILLIDSFKKYLDIDVEFIGSYEKET